MASSLDKFDHVQAAFVASAPGEDATPLELGLRTLLMTAGPMLRQSLPEHAGDLDDLLERGAQWLLGMRSDDAERLAVVYAGELERAGLELEADDDDDEDAPGELAGQLDLTGD